MPALGGRGPIAPRELAKAAKEPAPKAAKLPGRGPGAPAKGGSGKTFSPQLPGNPFSSGAPNLAAAYKNTQKPSPAGPPRFSGQLGRETKATERLKGLPKPPRTPQAPSLLSLATMIPGAALAGAERIITHPKVVLQDIPKEFKGEGATQLGASAAGNVMHGLTAAALGTKGPIAAVGQELTKLPAEAVNLPTQIAPTLYQAGRAAKGKIEGNPAAMQQLETGLKEGSLGKLVRGKPEAALKQAGKTPLQSGLEYTGAASLVDRGAG